MRFLTDHSPRNRYRLLAMFGFVTCCFFAIIALGPVGALACVIFAPMLAIIIMRVDGAPSKTS